MEKEMKKLLLVAVSVGVFLLVTITVALIVLTPKSQNNETAFSSSVPYVDARYIPNITNNVPEQPEINDTPLAAFNGNNERPEVVIISDRIEGDRLTIQVPLPSSTTIPEAPPVVRVPAPVRQPPVDNQVTTTTSGTAVTTPRPTNQPTPPVTAPRTTTPTPARTTYDFWIQTGAFSAMIRAEDAREQLASRGFVSIIENRVVDGRLFYRVRLGPYTSEREANHWLAIVKEIDGFKDNQLPENQRPHIRQTVRQQ
jgi:DedD protein